METNSALSAAMAAASGGAGAIGSTEPDKKEKKIGILAQARKYQRSLQTVQNKIGDVCDVAEQISAIVLWTDPRRSSMVLRVSLALSIILLLLPLRLILLVGGLIQFTAFFRRPTGTKQKLRNKLERLVFSAPVESDMVLTEQGLHPDLQK